MKKWLFILLCIPFVQNANAQSGIIDSIKLNLKSTPKFFIGFHNRNTFIRSNKTKLYGLIGGLDYNRKVKLFAGIYGFGRENETLLLNNNQFLNDTVYRYLNTSNFSVGIEYDYWDYERLHLSVPLQIGLGSSNNQYTESDKITQIRIDNFNYVPIEFGTNAYLELLTWVGIKAGVGYRINIGKKEALQLSSPYYNLGLSILVGEIYRDIKKNIEY
jgi:hypothetical protein